jgi:IS30 family transposase
VERLSALELERIEELLVEDAPFWRLRQEVPRSRYAIYRAVKRLRCPPVPEPNRSPLRLSLAEREEISRGLAAGESLRVMAGRLGRTPSTVSRQVARNGGRASYRACRADRAAVRNMRRPKVAKLARCPRLRVVMQAKLELRWSPQQIASWLVLEFPDDAEMRVSHETIYLSLFVQSRGALRKELTRYLRMKRSVRRPGGKAPHNGQSHIPAMVNISERPAEADDRAVPGHWESQWCCQAARATTGGEVVQVRFSRRSAQRTSTRLRARAMTAWLWVRPCSRFFR